MKANEFDTLIKEKFEQNSFEYNPVQWMKLADKLETAEPVRKKNRWLLPTAIGIAASFTLFAAVITLKPAHRSQLAQNHQPATSSVIAAPAPTTKKGSDHSIGNNIAATTATVKHRRNNVAAKTPETVATITNKPTYPAADVVTNSNSEKASTDIAFNTGTKNNNSKKQNVFSSLNESIIADASSDRNRKTIVSLAGGYNYGSIGSGYSVGATARHNISERLYVEADIAYVRNNSSSSQTKVETTYAYNTKTADPNTGIHPLADQITKETKLSTTTKSYNLNYLQVTPLMGYKLHKKVSVGVGPDIQRLIADNKPELSDVTPYSEIPGIDVGVMGRTELSLTDKVKASISYREALNNVLNGGTRFIDRSYLQFQLKFALNGRQ